MGVNMTDVINVLKNIAPYLVAFAAILVVAIVVMVACRKKEVAKKRLIRHNAGIAIVAALTVVVNLVCTGPCATLINLAFGDGKKTTVSETNTKAAIEINHEISRESFVLMKNEDDLLPLEKGKKLNVFGWSSTNPVYGGTGSGALSSAYDVVDILTALEDAGFETNKELSDFYRNWRSERPKITVSEQNWTIPEPTIAEYDAANIFEDAKVFSDTAVVVLSRVGGENYDLPTSYTNAASYRIGANVIYSEQEDDLDANKHYLELSNRERAMVERVADTFDHVIVIVNSANVMELGFVDEFDSIESVIYAPGPGQNGFTALGEIMDGDANPSGKLADTFVYDLTATPTFNNFGYYEYDNMEEFQAENGDMAEVLHGKPTYPSFVNYVENIYVGYKFYETAAKEGLIDYNSAVQYPFGYGLSYTTFTQSMSDLTVNDGVITFDVTVTNTGAVTGKDVVEVYYDPPYTNGGIEKASANLISFAKTNQLKPGESQTLSFSINAEDMASYDTYGVGGYVLEKGEYIISINSDSHNKLDSRTYVQDNTINYTGDNKRSTDLTTAENLFDFAEGNVNYLSRADHFANCEVATAAPADFSLADTYKSTFINNSNYNPEDYNNDNDEMPVTGANNGMQLAELRGASYDDPRWDTLLDNLTLSDMDTMIALSGYSTPAAESVGKVATVDCDGPASVNNFFAGQSSIGFNCGVGIACTWNTELATAFGDSIGTMADELGITGWYAPAMNIHRSAFAGRNFEYYSEDSYISGVMATNAMNAASAHGVYPYIKHFVMNEQETNRNGQLFTWASEQAVREIYLKPFEMCVKANAAKGGAAGGYPLAVMSSYNFIGSIPTYASSSLLNNVLRDEWGFEGMVLTDWYGSYGYQDADRAIRNGNDNMLATYDAGTNHLDDTTSATSLKAMRQASKNILYTVVNSRVYAAEQGMSMQTWMKAMIGVDVVIAALLILWEALAVRSYRKKKNAA